MRVTPSDVRRNGESWRPKNSSLRENALCNNNSEARTLSTTLKIGSHLRTVGECAMAVAGSDVLGLYVPYTLPNITLRTRLTLLRA